MPVCITYQCQHCGWIAPNDYQFMICTKCASDLKGAGFPAVNGTRDKFGIGREFRDKKTGKTIDNWKSWERAGYSSALDSHTIKGEVKEMVKAKVKKIKWEKDKGIRRERRLK